MTKGEDGVYSGVLTLSKGTPFDIRILKSSVSGTSGGNNVWSAVRYDSVLNSDSAHDFGEFIDNLVPNGDFESAEAQWTPASAIVERSNAHGGSKVLAIGGDTAVASSDVFTIPPNQTLKCSYYVRSVSAQKLTSVKVKDVDTQAIMIAIPQRITEFGIWVPATGTFKSGDRPVRAQVICQTFDKSIFAFDDIAIVST